MFLIEAVSFVSTLVLTSPQLPLLHGNLSLKGRDLMTISLVRQAECFKLPIVSLSTHFPNSDPIVNYHVPQEEAFSDKG